MPERVEEALEEESPYFFKFLGGLRCLTDDSDSLPGSSNVLAVSNVYGITVFSNQQGIYAARTTDLVSRSSRDVNKDYTLPNLESMCLWSARVFGVVQLSLSADELFVAAVGDEEISFFPLSGGNSGGDVQPAWGFSIAAQLQQFAWCRSVDNAACFAVLSEEHHLVLGSYGVNQNPTDTDLVASDVAAFDWSPDGRSLAYCVGASVVLREVETGLWSQVTLKAPDVEESELMPDSVRWLHQSALVLSCSVVQDDEEQGDVMVAQLTWRDASQGWGPAASEPGGEPSGTALHWLMPMAVEVDAAPMMSGPYLHTAVVPPWGAVVYAHRKANDDHVRVLRMGDPLASVDVVDDLIALRIPNARDNADNFIVGLAMDFTHPTGEVPHPLSMESPPLVPTPVLLVATSDGVLRFYNFGHLEVQEVLTRPAAPLPSSLPVWATQVSPQHDHDGAQQQQQQQQLTAAASASSEQLGAGLHDASSTAAAAALEAKALATPFPDDDEDDFDEEDDEVRPDTREQQPHGGKRTQSTAGLAAYKGSAQASEASDDEAQSSECGSTATSSLPTAARRAGRVIGHRTPRKSSSQGSDDRSARGSDAHTPSLGSRPAGGSDDSTKGHRYLGRAHEEDEEEDEDEVNSPGMPASSGKRRSLGASPVMGSSPTSARSPPPPAFLSLDNAASGTSRPAAQASNEGAAPAAAAAPAWGNFGSVVTGGGGFGSAAKPSGVFGSAAPPAFGTSGALFGGGGGVFGGGGGNAASAAAPASAPASPFGSSTFGSVNPLFGSGVSSPFGSKAPTVGFGGGGVPSAFGASSPFGGGTSGGTGVPPATITTAATGGLFGQAPGAFGSGSVFGNGKASGSTLSSKPPLSAPQSGPPTVSSGFGHPTTTAVSPGAPAKPPSVFGTGLPSQPPVRDPSAPAGGPGPELQRPLSGPVPGASSAPQPSAAQPAAASSAPPSLFGQQPSAAAAAKPAPATAAAAAAPPPPEPEREPSVPWPEAKLAGESAEIANMERDFLESLHSVRKMAADAERVMGGLTIGTGPASRSTYGALADGAAALLDRTKQLGQSYETGVQDVSFLAGSLCEHERRVAALQLFHRADDVQLLCSQLPLEPALAHARTTIQQQLSAVQHCMSDMDTQLELLEGQLAGLKTQPAGRRDARDAPARQVLKLPPTVIYNTVNMQGEALRNVSTRIHNLLFEMSHLGLRDATTVAGGSAAGTPYSLRGPGGAAVPLTPGAAATGGGKARRYSDDYGDAGDEYGEDEEAAWVVVPRTPGSVSGGMNVGGAACTSASDRPEWTTPRMPGRRQSPLVASARRPAPSALFPSAARQPGASPAETWAKAVPRLVDATRSGGRVRTTTTAAAAASPPPAASAAGGSAARAPPAPLGGDSPSHFARLVASPEGQALLAAARNSPPLTVSRPHQAAARSASPSATPRPATTAAAAAASRPSAPLPASSPFGGANMASFSFPQSSAGVPTTTPQAPSAASVRAAATGGGPITSGGAAAAPAPQAAAQVAKPKPAGGAAQPPPAAAAGTAAVPAKAAPKKASQPPMPSMAQMQAAANMQAQVAARAAQLKAAGQRAATPPAAAQPPAMPQAFGKQEDNAQLVHGDSDGGSENTANSTATSKPKRTQPQQVGLGAAAPPPTNPSQSAAPRVPPAAAGVASQGASGGLMNSSSLSDSSQASTAPGGGSAGAAAAAAPPTGAAFSFQQASSTPAAAAVPSLGALSFGGATKPAAAAAGGSPFGNFSFAGASTTPAFGSSAAGSAAAAPASPQQQQQGGFAAFGSSPASGAFASTPAPAAQQQSSGGAFSSPLGASPFGAPATVGSSSSFGAAPLAPAGGGVFGGGSAPAFGTAAPAFGSSSAPSFGSFAPATGGAFGATAAGGTFGSPAPATGGGMFGQGASAPNPAASPFGQSALAAAGPSLFGAFGQPTTGLGAATGGAFGASFGQPAAMGGGGVSLFGQPAAMGSAAPTGAGGFGQATGFGGGSVFGAPTAPAGAFGGGVFGQSAAAPAAFAAPQGGGFASYATQGGSAFGSLAGAGNSGGGGFGAFGGAAQQPAPPAPGGGSKMWEARR